MGDLKALADSIEQDGIKQPLHGTYDSKAGIWTIHDGHRRFAAAQMVNARVKEPGNKVEIPIKAVPADYTLEDRLYDMVTLNSGKSLNMLEEATLYQRLTAAGHTDADIARRVQKSPTHIKNCYILTTATEEVKRMIVAGKVAPTLVVEMLKKEDPDAVEESLVGAKKAVPAAKKITKKNVKPAAKKAGKASSKDTTQGPTPAKASPVVKESATAFNLLKLKKQVDEAIEAGATPVEYSRTLLVRMIELAHGTGTIEDVLAFFAEPVEEEEPDTTTAGNTEEE